MLGRAYGSSEVRKSLSKRQGLTEPRLSGALSAIGVELLRARSIEAAGAVSNDSRYTEQAMHIAAMIRLTLRESSADSPQDGSIDSLRLQPRMSLPPQHEPPLLHVLEPPGAIEQLPAHTLPEAA